jgi:hypothetical protein
MSEVGRKLRAEQRRKRAIIHRYRSNEAEPDIFPISGADAISLATSLTRESWSISGRRWPDYTRKDTPYRFVPGWPE